MVQDPFESFAEHYDAFERDDPARKIFFSRLAEKYGLQAVLDCACGTGHDLILFHSLGLDVTGSDISQSMLDIARNKLASLNITIPLNRIDFRYLHDHLNREFDAVFCLSTSLPQLLEESEILKALVSTKDVLRSGGILVLSQGLTDRQYKFRNRFFPVVNTPEFSRVMVVDYHESEWEVHVLDMIHTVECTDFKTSSFRYRLLLRDDYERLLNNAKFARYDFLGSMKFEPYDKNSSGQLIIIAEK